MTSSLQFKTLNTFENTNTLEVHSFTTSGHSDFYYSEYKKLSEVFTYIHSRYLEQSKDCIKRNIKLHKISNNCCVLLQISQYKTFTSFKSYNIHTKDKDTLEICLNMFENTKF